MASQTGFVRLLAAAYASAFCTAACRKANRPTGTAAQLSTVTIQAVMVTPLAYDEDGATPTGWCPPGCACPVLSRPGLLLPDSYHFWVPDRRVVPPVPPVPRRAVFVRFAGLGVDVLWAGVLWLAAARLAALRLVLRTSWAASLPASCTFSATVSATSSA